MKFRLDFDKNLDLAPFQKSAYHYLKNDSQQFIWDVYLRDFWFRFVADDNSAWNLKEEDRHFALNLWETTTSGEIRNRTMVFPHDDSRLKTFPIFHENWLPGSPIFETKMEVGKMITMVSEMIRILHKIKELESFL